MTDLIEVKTADLTGPALDWAIAQIEGIRTLMVSPRKGEPKKPFAIFGSLALSVSGDDQSSYAPSTCWHCGGPLIEKYMLRVAPHCMSNGVVKSWAADMTWPCNTMPGRTGPTMLVAACRAIVMKELGTQVRVPKELAP